MKRITGGTKHATYAVLDALTNLSLCCYRTLHAPALSRQLMMLQSSDPSVLLSELRELQRKQVSPSQADVILSTVHKAKV